MKTLIKSVSILDPRSPHNGKVRDVLIDKGKIVSIAANITEIKGRIIKGKELYLSPGWIDMRANFRDPGLEYKEDLNSGTLAARRGGFSRVLLMPSLLPVTDQKGSVEYLVRRNPMNGVQLLVAGCLSEGLLGKQLAELFDMSQSGAIAFTDDKNDVGTELMLRALEYSKNFNGLLISFPHDRGVNPNGIIHEGVTSVSMGLRGLSSMSEEMRLSRDLDLLRYSGGRLHISLISTARSVQMIRLAKKEGLKVSCGIAAHQLSFTDENMLGFDSNMKVLPPFRSKADNKALLDGLKDGTIDVICSDHSPEDVEHKKREFEDADFGISSIQTAFNSIFDSIGKSVDISIIAAALSTSPAKILNQDLPVIEAGAEAEVTLFTTAEDTLFNESNWKSKSRFSPFYGKKLRGKVLEL
ncbi:MAG: dihydroorotase [Flavobacteriales bacterium]|nr:dihydroorotase [Flavobacteriales bacterium]